MKGTSTGGNHGQWKQTQVENIGTCKNDDETDEGSLLEPSHTSDLMNNHTSSSCRTSPRTTSFPQEKGDLVPGDSAPVMRSQRAGAPWLEDTDKDDSNSCTSADSDSAEIARIQQKGTVDAKSSSSRSSVKLQEKRRKLTNRSSSPATSTQQAKLSFKANLAKTAEAELQESKTKRKAGIHGVQDVQGAAAAMRKDYEFCSDQTNTCSSLLWEKRARGTGCKNDSGLHSELSSPLLRSRANGCKITNSRAIASPSDQSQVLDTSGVKTRQRTEGFAGNDEGRKKKAKRNQSRKASLDEGQSEMLNASRENSEQQYTSRQGQEDFHALLKQDPRESSNAELSERQDGVSSTSAIMSRNQQGDFSTPRISQTRNLASTMLPLYVPLSGSSSTTALSQDLARTRCEETLQLDQHLAQSSIPLLLQQYQLGGLAMPEHSNSLLRSVMATNLIHPGAIYMPSQHLPNSLASAWIMYPQLASYIQQRHGSPPWIDGMNPYFAAFENVVGGSTGISGHPEAMIGQMSEIQHGFSQGTSGCTGNAADALRSRLVSTRETRSIDDLLGSLTASRNPELSEVSVLSYAASTGNSMPLPANRGVQERNTPPIYRPRGIKSLSLESDSECLSPYQCFVRQQVLLFEAQHDETECGVQGRSRTVAIGQVGILCRHCAHTKPQSRRRGAMYFPFKIMSMYQAAQNMVANHFLTTCPDVTIEIRQRLKILKEEPSSMVYDGKLYWANAARTMGIEECEYGLRFRKLDH